MQTPTDFCPRDEHRVGHGGVGFRFYIMISVRENAEDGCGAVKVSIGQRRLTRIENWHFIQTAAQAEGAEELRQLCGDFIPNCMGFCQGEARHFDGHEAMRK